mgnify:CR=1 FL=1
MHSDNVRKHILMQMQQRTSRQGREQINLEQDTISLLLKHFRVDKHANRLRDANQQMYGTRELTTLTFNAQAVGFPYLLICSTLDGIKLHDDKRCTLPKMFASFDATPLGVAYHKAAKDIRTVYGSDSRAPCLVVKRVNVRGGLAIYPTDDAEDGVSGLRLCYTPSEESPLGPTTIEPFVSLLNRCKSVWTPQFALYEE